MQKAPPTPHHGTGKGLMIVQGPVASGPIQRLVSHKEYVVEMVNLIIKDMDMDECGKHAIEDLGVFGFFDLVAALYPDLDLSRVVIDDLILPMPGIADAVLSEANDIVYLVEGELKKPA
nr:hypothetical protein CFP56_44506 [Quercus suber]